jgi:histidinol phosphatase-like PHP family hydrolase
MADSSLFARCDLHVHTALSPCGWAEMSLEAIIRAAEEQGIEHLAITDHIHPGTDRAIVAQVGDEIRRVEKSIDVYLGCEVDITAVGAHEVDQDLLQMTDFVIVSANHFQETFVSQPRSAGKTDVALHFLEMFNYAASLEFVDVIAHPLYVMPGTYDPKAPAELSAEDLMPAIRMLKKNNIAVEISRRALAPEQTPFLLSFYRLCKQESVKFSIGSDAHKLADVGRTRLVEPLVTELDLQDDNIWLPYGGAHR